MEQKKQSDQPAQFLMQRLIWHYEEKNKKKFSSKGGVTNVPRMDFL